MMTMMVDVGLKVLLREISIPGHNLEVKVKDLKFSYKSQTFCIKVYIAILSRPLVDFIDIWGDGIYRSKVLLSAIPKLG